MASLLIPSYTGIIQDVHITVISRILGIPLGTQRLSPVFGEPEPRPPFPSALVRDHLYLAIIEFQGNAEVEAMVLGLVAEYLGLPQGDWVENGEMKINVRRRKREIGCELRLIYTLPEVQGGGGVELGR